MSAAFHTEDDLAALLGVTVDKAVSWRRRYGWPHVKLGREVRYTDADVQAIAAKHHVESAAADSLPGQTALSAARSR